MVYWIHSSGFALGVYITKPPYGRNICEEAQEMGPMRLECEKDFVVIIYYGMYEIICIVMVMHITKPSKTQTKL